MLVFDSIIWPLLVVWILSMLESNFLTSGKHRVRLGIKLWSEALPDGYQLFFIALKKNIVSTNSKFFSFPDYIVKFNNLVKIYSPVNKAFPLIPIVAFINLSEHSPKIKYRCPVIPILFYLPIVLIVSVTLVLLVYTEAINMMSLILAVSPVVIVLVLLIFYLSFRAGRKSINRYIINNINNLSHKTL